MPSHDGLPSYGVGEEIAHAVTHGVGLVLSIAALVVLVARAAVEGDALQLAGSVTFGTTLVLLYAASTFYHALTHRRAKRVFQRLDHAAIYLLIAGTYTPFTLVSLGGGAGFTLLAVVWGLAVLGIVIESVGRAARPRLALHLGMGWSVLFVAEPLVRTMEPAGLALLVAGGVAYSAGVPFYAWNRLAYNHAIWHGFVLLGSACHVACVLGYVVPSAA